jgi:hypothetical protein
LAAYLLKDGLALTEKRFGVAFAIVVKSVLSVALICAAVGRFRAVVRGLIQHGSR